MTTRWVGEVRFMQVSLISTYLLFPFSRFNENNILIKETSTHQYKECRALNPECHWVSTVDHVLFTPKF